MPITCPTVEIIDEQDMNAELDARIRVVLRACFPDWQDIFAERRTWHSTPPIFSVLAKDGGCESSHTNRSEAICDEALNPEGLKGEFQKNASERKIVGHIAVVVRTLTTTWNFRYNVASIQGVCVLPAERRTGLAHQMLQQAVEEIRRRGFLFAILYCKEHLVSFYASQGWKLADDSIVMWNQRDLPVSMRSNCPMYRELGDVPLPDGPLDVHSPSW